MLRAEDTPPGSRLNAMDGSLPPGSSDISARSASPPLVTDPSIAMLRADEYRRDGGMPSSRPERPASWMETKAT
jgi:hypothetical protein